MGRAPLLLIHGGGLVGPVLAPAAAHGHKHPLGNGPILPLKFRYGLTGRRIALVPGHLRMGAGGAQGEGRFLHCDPTDRAAARHKADRRAAEGALLARKDVLEPSWDSPVPSQRVPPLPTGRKPVHHGESLPNPWGRSPQRYFGERKSSDSLHRDGIHHSPCPPSPVEPGDAPALLCDGTIIPFFSPDAI